MPGSATAPAARCKNVRRGISSWMTSGSARGGASSLMKVGRSPMAQVLPIATIRIPACPAERLGTILHLFCDQVEGDSATMLTHRVGSPPLIEHCEGSFAMDACYLGNRISRFMEYRVCPDQSGLAPENL